MAKIKCAECGREISDKATHCVHCGAPVRSARGSNAAAYWTLGLAGALIAIVVIAGASTSRNEIDAHEAYEACKALLKERVVPGGTLQDCDGIRANVLRYGLNPKAPTR